MGAMELRDLLTQLIDALTEEGVIVPETSLPTIDAARTAALKNSTGR
jgi:hypothetical protein